jgi:hypothetical protein
MLSAVLLNVANNLFMLSVVMINVIMLRAVVPNEKLRIIPAHVYEK